MQTNARVHTEELPLTSMSSGFYPLPRCLPIITRRNPIWQLISDNATVYTDIIEPIGHQAKEKNEEFLKAYAKVVNKFTLNFAQEFCDDGEINWKRIVEFNSKKKQA